MKPLLDLRESMVEERNVSENRSETRRNGQRAVTEDGHNQGNYTEKYRAQLLEQILATQKQLQESNPNITLINNQEMVAIQVIWNRDLNFEYKVSEIYNRIYNQVLEMEAQDEKLQREIKLLKDVCSDDLKDYNLIQELLTLQKNKALLSRKRGLKDDMERVIDNYLKVV